MKCGFQRWTRHGSFVVVSSVLGCAGALAGCSSDASDAWVETEESEWRRKPKPGRGGSAGTGGTGGATGGSGGATGGSGGATGGSGGATGGSGGATGGSGGATGGSGGATGGTGGATGGTGGSSEQPRAVDNVLFLGHSLINLDVPWVVRGVALSADEPFAYRAQINNGASLRAQWENPDKYNPIPIWNPELGRDEDWGTNARQALTTGAFDAFVMTEAVPIEGNLTYNDTVGFAGLYYDLAVQHRPDIQVYLYRTWEPVVSGNFAGWRSDIDRTRPIWEKIVDDVMATRQGPPLLIVPGGEALAALYDAVQEGPVGQISHISQIFADDIHLNATGNYFIGLVHYATVLGRDPAGTPAVEAGPYQRHNLVVQDPATRGALQAIAWQVVTSYPRSGVTR